MNVIAAVNGQITSEVAALYGLHFARIHDWPLVLLLLPVQGPVWGLSPANRNRFRDLSLFRDPGRYPCRNGLKLLKHSSRLSLIRMAVIPNPILVMKKMPNWIG